MKPKFLTLAVITCLLLAAVVIVRAQDNEARRHQLHSLGGPFIVYRTNVQQELKLSDDEKQKLQAKLPDYLSPDLKASDAREKLWAFLKDLLPTEQLKRFQQLELQHEGPSALLSRPEIARELNITDEQRAQFMSVVQNMRKELEPLMKEAHSGGNREEIRVRATKIYGEQEAKIEAILNDAQKARWKEMSGSPFDVFNDN